MLELLCCWYSLDDGPGATHCGCTYPHPLHTHLHPTTQSGLIVRRGGVGDRGDIAIAILEKITARKTGHCRDGYQRLVAWALDRTPPLSHYQSGCVALDGGEAVSNRGPKASFDVKSPVRMLSPEQKCFGGEEGVCVSCFATKPAQHRYRERQDSLGIPWTTLLWEQPIGCFG